MECNSLPQDSYQAGLTLACEIWHLSEKDREYGFSFHKIVRDYDGVKLYGTFESHQFWLAINYATEDKILLSTHLKQRLLTTRQGNEATLARILTSFKKLVKNLPGRI